MATPNNQIGIADSSAYFSGKIDTLNVTCSCTTYVSCPKLVRVFYLSAKPAVLYILPSIGKALYPVKPLDLTIRNRRYTVDFFHMCTDFITPNIGRY